MAEKETEIRRVFKEDENGIPRPVFKEDENGIPRPLYREVEVEKE